MFSNSTPSAGVFGRTVSDVELMFDALQGVDPLDPTSVDVGSTHTPMWHSRRVSETIPTRCPPIGQRRRIFPLDVLLLVSDVELMFDAGSGSLRSYFRRRGQHAHPRVAISAGD
jgi:hypothetical protein